MYCLLALALYGRWASVRSIVLSTVLPAPDTCDAVEVLELARQREERCLSLPVEPETDMSFSHSSIIVSKSCNRDSISCRSSRCVRSRIF